LKMSLMLDPFGKWTFAKGHVEPGETIEQEVQQFATALGLNRDVYELFVRIDIRILNEEDKRLIEHTLRDFRRSGVDKDEETRNAIKELNENN